MKNIIKNTNKKGFTIVELVIVIAVIAILAGVLIPTFSSIITRAHESAALQEATNTYKELLTEEPYNGDLDLNSTPAEPDLYIVITKPNKTYYFQVVDGKISLANINSLPETGYESVSTPAGYTNVYVYTPTPSNPTGGENQGA